MNDLIDVGKPRLRDKIIRPVMDLDRIVVADCFVFLIREQPRVMKPRVVKIDEVDVRIGKRKACHAAL